MVILTRIVKTNKGSLFTCAVNKRRKVGITLYHIVYPDSGCRERNLKCILDSVYVFGINLKLYAVALGKFKILHRNDDILTRFSACVLVPITVGRPYDLAVIGYADIDIGSSTLWRCNLKTRKQFKGFIIRYHKFK